MNLQTLAALTDADLLARAQVLARDERRATAILVAHLAEIENRKLYLGQACTSMFVYCVRVLHLSEHAAYNRIEAARAARRFPAVLASLEQGLVHLTAVRLLSPVLTDDNHRDVLAQATHKSKREVEELLARLRPQPDVGTQVRKLPASKAASPRLEAAIGSQQPSDAATERTIPPDAPPLLATAPADTACARPAACPPAKPATVVPLAPARYKMQLTISAATRDKLRRAQDLLRHRIPDGDVAIVVDLALDLLVRDLEKKKFAAADRPRPARGTAAAETPAPGTTAGETPAAGTPAAAFPAPGAPAPRAREQAPLAPHSRHIPADVKRAVWARDLGCCAFVAEDGTRCGERGGLEFDHIRPHADGGEATVNNVRLLCRQHNQYESQQFFGLWQAEGRHETQAAMQLPAGTRQAELVPERVGHGRR